MVLSAEQRRLEYLKGELKAGRISNRQFKAMRADENLTPYEMRRRSVDAQFTEGTREREAALNAIAAKEAEQILQVKTVEAPETQAPQDTTFKDTPREPVGSDYNTRSLIYTGGGDAAAQYTRSTITTPTDPTGLRQFYVNQYYDDVAENVRLKRALPVTLRQYPALGGRITLRQEQKEIPQEPSALSKAWGKLNTPVKLDKIPFIGERIEKNIDTGRKAFMLLQGTQLRGARNMQASDNKIASQFGKISESGIKYNVEGVTWMEAEARKPSMWATAVAGNLLFKGLGWGAKVAAKVPGVGRVVTSPLATKTTKYGLLTLYGASEGKNIYEGKKTAGQVTGQFIARAGAFAVTGGIMDATASGIKSTYQNVQQWRANRAADKAFNQWQKSITGDKWRLSEGALGSQRTLTSGSTSDKQVRAALNELNKYKIDTAGKLEINPLRPYNTDQYTQYYGKVPGQKIVAVDKTTGNLFGTRVFRGGPVFVERGGRSFEFSPDKYNLVTIPGQSRYFFTNPPSTGTERQLNIWGAPVEGITLRFTSPYSSSTPTPPPPTTPAGPTPSAGGDGGGSAAVLRAATKTDTDTIATLFSPKPSLNIIQNVPEAMAPQPPITTVDTNPALAIPNFAPPKTGAQYINILSPGQGELNPVKIFDLPTSKPKINILPVTSIKPIDTLLPGIKQNPRTGIDFSTVERTDTRQTPAQDTINPFPIPTPGPVVPVIDPGDIIPEVEPPPPITPGLPIFWFNRPRSPRGAPFRNMLKVRQPKSYFPTLKSNILAEVGTPLKGVLTGFENRPVPRRKKKKGVKR